MTEIENQKSKIENPLSLRWLSAGIGIPLLLYITFLGGVPVSLALLLLAYLGLRELWQAYRRAGFRPALFLAAAGLLAPAWPLLAGPSAISVATARLYGHLTAILVILVVLALLLEAWNSARHGILLMGRSIGYGLVCGFTI